MPKIFTLIKTPCGRSKYIELNSKKGALSKLRLIWFILIAIIKDWNIPSPDQKEDSNS